MNWEYRILKKQIKKNEYILEIKEVYYDENGEIYGYGDVPVLHGETEQSIRECLELMCEALSKPIIEYKKIKE